LITIGLGYKGLNLFPININSIDYLFLAKKFKIDAIRQSSTLFC